MTEGAGVKKIDEFNAEDRIEVRLLENSVHFLHGEITEENVLSCIKWITYENLDRKEKKKLTLYINSIGGDLYQAFALIDVIKNSYHPVSIIGMGAVMSAAFLVFAAGTKGSRVAAKNCSFMCHQYSETFTGKHHDLKATMKEGEMYNAKMIDVLQEATGLPRAKIRSKLLPASDVYMNAEEVLELGVADHIL
jgi:ATP-dependent Clp protease protease subunit